MWFDEDSRIFAGFEAPETDEGFLRQRLLEEQEHAKKANQARLEAEARCRVAERERDVYRLLARRWQSRLQVLLQQQREGDTPTEQGSGQDANDDEEFLLNGREQAVIFGLGAMLRGFPSESDDDEESNDSSNNDNMHAMDAEATDDNESVSDSQLQTSDDEVDDEDSQFDFSDEEESQGAVVDVVPSGSFDRADSSASKELGRSQARTVRTVSLSSDSF